MFSSHLLKRVKKMQEDKKKKEMIETAERVSAEKLNRIYNYHQKKITDREQEIPIIIKGIQAELEIIENAEPQRLREIFLQVKGGIRLIEKRLEESSEEYELYHRRRKEEVRRLEEQGKILRGEEPDCSQRTTEL